MTNAPAALGWRGSGYGLRAAWDAFPGWTRAAGVLLVVACAAMAPSFALPNDLGHSAIFNDAWSIQFSDQLAAGQLYPRWLEHGNDGLGSPAFYFYPPLAFYVAAAAKALGFGALNVAQVWNLADLILLFASGVAMYAWLRDHAAHSPALIGAAAYMLAPYHLTDHYVRAAVAEFATFVFVPLAALGLHQVAQRRPAGLGLLPLAYAGLIYSHLPVALLASVLVFPPYALFLAFNEAPRERRLGFLLASAGLAAIGAGLAGLYLVPALTLERFISTERLWNSYYDVTHWMLIHPNLWSNDVLMTGIAGFSAAALSLVVGAGLALVRQGKLRSENAAREAMFWCAMVAIGVAVLAGLVPGFWRLPMLTKVQFPWRAMGLVEFAAVTAVVTTVGARGLRLPWPSRSVAAVAIAGGITAMLPLQIYTLELSREMAPTIRARVTRELRDPREYLPAGFSDFRNEGDQKANPRLLHLRDYPLAESSAGGVSAREAADGSLTVQVSGAGPRRVVLKRFFFPAWRVVDPLGRPVATAPFGPARRLSFEATRPGTYRATIQTVPSERVGGAISGAAALALCAILLASGLRGKTRLGPKHPRTLAYIGGRS